MITASCRLFTASPSARIAKRISAFRRLVATGERRPLLPCTGLAGLVSNVTVATAAAGASYVCHVTPSTGHASVTTRPVVRVASPLVVAVATGTVASSAGRRPITTTTGLPTMRTLRTTVAGISALGSITGPSVLGSAGFASALVTLAAPSSAAVATISTTVLVGTLTAFIICHVLFDGLGLITTKGLTTTSPLGTTTFPFYRTNVTFVAHRLLKRPDLVAIGL